jgi:hypothetical protein
MILATGFSTQSLVTYLQALIAPLLLGTIGIMAVVFLFKREITKFAEFLVLAVGVAIVFYTPQVIQVIATGIAAALGVHS